MKKRLVSGVTWIVAAMLVVPIVSCSAGGGAAPAASAPVKSQVTYRCLISSCDATVTANEGDSVPEHHGKPMMK